METNAINALMGSNHKNKELEFDGIRYVLYSRKSCEADELQALSIESQIHEMTALAEREGLLIVDILKESHSAKDSGQRPVFQEMVKGIREGKYTGIIAWDPSRISRNAGDLGSIVDLMDQKLLFEIRTFGQRFSNSPNEKFLLMILCSQAKLENDHKGENVKRGLRAKCAQGWRPGVPPLGYMHDETMKKGSKKVLVDPARAPIIKQMFERVAEEDVSGRDIFDWFREIGFVTRTNKRVAISAIYRMLKDPYYYGEFEYPIGKGTWYKGGYEPIITKELYLKAQANLHAPPRKRPGTNEFAFTQLFKCGNCGSGISAEEKFKRQKNGTVHRYVYYLCSKGSGNRDCKEKYIREEELISQLAQMTNKLDMDEFDIKDKIQREIKKFKQFSYSILGKEIPFEEVPDIVDVRNYFKYILLNGTKDEKRDVLGCLKTRVEIKDKTIYLKI